MSPPLSGDSRGVLNMNLTSSGIAAKIKDGSIKKVVVLTGAGLSVAAGIPDFRSPGSGLYSNLQRFNLPRPEAVFEIDFFRENPSPFFELARDLYPGQAMPTKAHYFLRLLAERGLCTRIYTQNIDTLERIAGVPDDVLVEAHGSFETATCTSCREGFSKEWVGERLFGEEGGIPRCTTCGGVVKPDITFFGENLPPRFAQLHRKDTADADLLIVMGTSLKVHPVAGLPSLVPALCPRLLINLEPVFVKTPVDSDEYDGDTGGFRFNLEDNYRDVFLEGTCDEGVERLALSLGWTDALNELHASETAALKESFAKRAAARKATKPLPVFDPAGSAEADTSAADASAGAGSGAGGGGAPDGDGDGDDVAAAAAAAAVTAPGFSDVSDYLDGASTPAAHAAGSAAVKAAGFSVADDAEATLSGAGAADADADAPGAGGGAGLSP